MATVSASDGTMLAVDGAVGAGFAASRGELSAQLVSEDGVATVEPTHSSSAIVLGGDPTLTVNRVYDSVEGDFVRWRTDGPNPDGSSYPGPGVFGVDTSDYVVEDQEV